MKCFKILSVVMLSCMIAGCGASGSPASTPITSESSESDDILDTLLESSSVSSCISKYLEYVGSPDIDKTDFVSRERQDDETGAWLVKVCVHSGDNAYGLLLLYWPENDICQCLKVYDWNDMSVYWSADPTEEIISSKDPASGEVDSGQVDSENPFSEESGSEKPAKNLIDGVVVDYRGAFDDDVTGNWRLSAVVTEKTIDEFAFDYYKSYFNSDDEIHWVVNYSDNTTSCINCISGYLSITEYSHVDGEENSAKKIGGGSHISDFLISAKDGSPADF